MPFAHNGSYTGSSPVGLNLNFNYHISFLFSWLLFSVQSSIFYYIKATANLFVFSEKKE